MHKHAEKEHPENVGTVDFEWKVKRTFLKPLKRQIFEAKCIDQMIEEETLNSKDEFNGQTLKKLELVRKVKINCKVCGAEFNKSDDHDNHFKKFHERFICERCDYKSFGEKDLQIHMKKHVSS